MTYKFEKLMEECAKQAGTKLERIEMGGRHYKVYVRGKYPGMVVVSLTPKATPRFEKNVITDMRKVTTQPQRGVK
jgi:hypothetical protein